jgi:hypothetical protein
MRIAKAGRDIRLEAAHIAACDAYKDRGYNPSVTQTKGQTEDIRTGRLRRYELNCYRSWLANVQAQIERDHRPKTAMGFMEAVNRIIGRQQPSSM